MVVIYATMINMYVQVIEAARFGVSGARGGRGLGRRRPQAGALVAKVTRSLYLSQSPST